MRNLMLSLAALSSVALFATGFFLSTSQHLILMDVLLHPAMLALIVWVSLCTLWGLVLTAKHYQAENRPPSPSNIEAPSPSDIEARQNTRTLAFDVNHISVHSFLLRDDTGAPPSDDAVQRCIDTLNTLSENARYQWLTQPHTQASEQRLRTGYLKACLLNRAFDPHFFCFLRIAQRTLTPNQQHALWRSDTYLISDSPAVIQRFDNPNLLIGFIHELIFLRKKARDDHPSHSGEEALAEVYKVLRTLCNTLADGSMTRAHYTDLLSVSSHGPLSLILIEIFNLITHFWTSPIPPNEEETLTLNAILSLPLPYTIWHDSSRMLRLIGNKYAIGAHYPPSQYAHLSVLIGIISEHTCTAIYTHLTRDYLSTQSTSALSSLLEGLLIHAATFSESDATKSTLFLSKFFMVHHLVYRRGLTPIITETLAACRAHNKIGRTLLHTDPVRTQHVLAHTLLGHPTFRTLPQCEKMDVCLDLYHDYYLTTLRPRGTEANQPGSPYPLCGLYAAALSNNAPNDDDPNVARSIAQLCATLADATYNNSQGFPNGNPQMAYSLVYCDPNPEQEENHEISQSNCNIQIKWVSTYFAWPHSHDTGLSPTDFLHAVLDEMAEMLDITFPTSPNTQDETDEEEKVGLLSPILPLCSSANWLMRYPWKKHPHAVRLVLKHYEILYSHLFLQDTTLYNKKQIIKTTLPSPITSPSHDNKEINVPVPPRSTLKP